MRLSRILALKTRIILHIPDSFVAKSEGDQNLIKGLATKGFTNFITTGELYELREEAPARPKLRPIEGANLFGITDL